MPDMHRFTFVRSRVEQDVPAIAGMADRTLPQRRILHSSESCSSQYEKRTTESAMFDRQPKYRPIRNSKIFIYKILTIYLCSKQLDLILYASIPNFEFLEFVQSGCGCESAVFLHTRMTRVWRVHA